MLFKVTKCKAFVIHFFKRNSFVSDFTVEAFSKHFVLDIKNFHLGSKEIKMWSIKKLYSIGEVVTMKKNVVNKETVFNR